MQWKMNGKSLSKFIIITIRSIGAQQHDKWCRLWSTDPLCWTIDPEFGCPLVDRSKEFYYWRRLFLSPISCYCCCYYCWWLHCKQISAICTPQAIHMCACMAISVTVYSECLTPCYVCMSVPVCSLLHPVMSRSTNIIDHVKDAQ